MFWFWFQIFCCLSPVELLSSFPAIVLHPVTLKRQLINFVWFPSVTTKPKHIFISYTLGSVSYRLQHSAVCLFVLVFTDANHLRIFSLLQNFTIVDFYYARSYSFGCELENKIHWISHEDIKSPGKLALSRNGAGAYIIIMIVALPITQIAHELIHVSPRLSCLSDEQKQFP